MSKVKGFCEGKVSVVQGSGIQMRGNWIGQEVDKYKTEVKYSYYAILILDTIQPIVNSSTTSES